MVHFTLNLGLIQKVLRKSPAVYNNMSQTTLYLSLANGCVGLLSLHTSAKGSLTAQIHAYCLICRITRYCFFFLAMVFLVSSFAQLVCVQIFPLLTASKSPCLLFTSLAFQQNKCLQITDK